MRLRPAHRVDGCAPGLEAGPFPVTRFCGATVHDLDGPSLATVTRRPRKVVGVSSASRPNLESPRCSCA